MKKLIQFLEKYEFPLHLFALRTIVRNTVSLRLSTWRAKLKLRLMSCSFGNNFKVDGTLWVQANRKGTIRIGDNVRINSRFGSNLVGLTNPAIFQCLDEGVITIGNNSGLSSAVLSARASITIGDNVMVGGNVRIFDHNYHSLDFRKRRNLAEDQPDCKRSPVVIGNDVFIGTNAMILKGVTLGDRAIIGAGSVVSCDVPADEVWAGNPARCVRAAQAPSV
jgi:acetyltransferase-like isoleucine patch superfamily enzyme